MKLDDYVWTTITNRPEKARVFLADVLADGVEYAARAEERKNCGKSKKTSAENLEGWSWETSFLRKMHGEKKKRETLHNGEKVKSLKSFVLILVENSEKINYFNLLEYTIELL